VECFRVSRQSTQRKRRSNAELSGTTPASADALDAVLPQREPVIVSGRKIADVQTDPRELSDLCHLSLREEVLSDSTLIEDLNGA
jgi:hypothetical protein